ncbi:sugar nucleotide-binding protein [Simiduia sp. 21SJ11W-1]|uniref:NAD-dependent epimerase/dehydratase family protein n=1 Tax=Simiduia sp. 21SJ11W-1 TaxID=2909669 RepID=UPI00209D42FD|nr:NAD-dependent epimerase/dehydratase family protein [Simiduia sp. 21SJ11W-1]UTA47985.1 sugar nucleotide-binding protein [Simiduia sp. 21SJ11W-1]
MKAPSTLLLGFGDIAERVAALLDGPWAGARRSASGRPEVVAADATKSEDLLRLLGKGYQRILVTLTPPERTDAGYRASYVAAARALTEALATLELRPRIVWVSSTSVYGQNAGQWVDETSPTEPAGFAGKRLLEAESLLLASGLDVVIARLSGIYGPGRDRLLSQVRAGQVSRNMLAYSNRIHADDAACALHHLLALPNPETHYIVTDDAPVLLAEVVRGMAQALGVPGPEQSQGAPFTGKRLCNNRLKASGWQPRYPDWRAGYQAELTALKAP